MAYWRTHYDRNHHELANYLESKGVIVIDTAAVGYGFPDMVCKYRGIVFMVEVKMPKGGLNKTQKEFHSAVGSGIYILKSKADCDNLLCTLDNVCDTIIMRLGEDESPTAQLIINTLKR